MQVPVALLQAYVSTTRRLICEADEAVEYASDMVQARVLEDLTRVSV